jgi:hypothetical protein
MIDGSLCAGLRLASVVQTVNGKTVESLQGPFYAGLDRKPRRGRGSASS